MKIQKLKAAVAVATLAALSLGATAANAATANATARANLVFADFVREVYWNRYSSGRNDLQLEDARTFVVNSVREGKTQKPWSETTIKRMSSYLMGCCADYGLLTTTGRNVS